jgi:hypothetical protein
MYPNGTTLYVAKYEQRQHRPGHDTKTHTAVQTIATQPWPVEDRVPAPTRATMQGDHLLVSLGNANYIGGLSAVNLKDPRDPASSIGSGCRLTTFQATAVNGPNPGHSSSRGIDVRSGAESSTSGPWHRPRRPGHSLTAFLDKVCHPGLNRQKYTAKHVQNGWDAAGL